MGRAAVRAADGGRMGLDALNGLRNQFACWDGRDGQGVNDGTVGGRVGIGHGRVGR